jgi:hypothetical protein
MAEVRRSAFSMRTATLRSSPSSWEGHRALELGHAVVHRQELVVGFGALVVPRLVDEEPNPARERVVIGHDHTALAGGDVLALLQAEDGDVAEGADLLAAVAGSKGLRTVLDQG